MARLKFKYLKHKAIAKVADPIKQAAFIAFYENLLNTLADDETVYFADAVHPEYHSKSAFGWVRKGSNPAILTTSGRGRVIHVIWDNAAYHRGTDVRAFLARKNCRIHLVQLTPYCPHLIPIERLWAVMHRHVTHNRYYKTQKQFADAILKFFTETIPKDWAGFCDQVTDNFRNISNHELRILK